MGEGSSWMGSAGMLNRDGAGLPPLDSRRKEIWEYYRLDFLEDGYPGRRTGELLAPHPLYGTYVISDYLAQYRQTKDVIFLQAAQKVADSAIMRMEARGDALVFMYDPGTGISSLPNRFYSGLTQARYLDVLGRLYRASGDSRYLDASEAVFRSLSIPAAEGGVARTTPGGGTVIEEYAHGVPDYTLNGWTTATLLTDDYSAACPTDEVAAFVSASMQGIRDVLPLYDVPDLANSRYRLTGSARIKFSFSRSGCALADTALVIPTQGRFPVTNRARHKWENAFLGDVAPDGTARGTSAEAQLLLSRVSWPAPNRLTSRVTAAGDTTLTISIGEGPYLPLRSQLRPQSYRVITELTLGPGENVIDVPIPWTRAELIAYPTNFGKKIGGRAYNQYHFIHIDTLQELATRTGDDLFAYYAERWNEYPERWPDMREYTGAGLMLQRHRVTAASGAPTAAGAEGRLRLKTKVKARLWEGLGRPSGRKV